MKVLYSEQQIKSRVEEIGKEIARDFLGEQLLLLGVLNGGFIFTADLCRSIAIPHEVDFIGVSSYGDGTSSSGNVQYTKTPKEKIRDQNIILVEDIVDTGNTIEFLWNALKQYNPKEIRIAALFWKKEKAKKTIPVHYPGFVIQDEFVIGYGLDYAGKYRNLPYVGIYESNELQ
ncbi:hypoxanthine phosphoribosyltransferase [Leptospira ryugenii]|uniref:Hypoxanthine phosphoribosyltransferase n=1 Tax=Leptospira ryugenii TaxID=1917863 RepID=A0A2P2E413_9LEPT|nr:hypoxanthine phosphoribosyltransferase [Leptospira ryugenii]GBF51627.1 hypoxanthine phosphoribosyltransferase [Leptospira ryugenii]